eukprot:5231778-Prymnesium_polylepis.1
MGRGYPLSHRANLPKAQRTRSTSRCARTLPPASTPFAVRAGAVHKRSIRCLRAWPPGHARARVRQPRRRAHDSPRGTSVEPTGRHARRTEPAPTPGLRALLFPAAAAVGLVCFGLVSITPWLSLALLLWPRLPEERRVVPRAVPRHETEGSERATERQKGGARYEEVHEYEDREELRPAGGSAKGVCEPGVRIGVFDPRCEALRGEGRPHDGRQPDKAMQLQLDGTPLVPPKP